MINGYKMFKVGMLFTAVLAFVLIVPGCNSPEQRRRDTDRVAADIIAQKQQEALGREYDFSIEKPIEAFRQLLLADQELPYSHDGSLGTGNLEQIEHWPEDNYPAYVQPGNPNSDIDPTETITISLMEALQIGAANSRQYQDRKEDVFRSALSLELERNNFRSIFTGRVEERARTTAEGGSRSTGMSTSGDFAASRTLTSGVSLTTALATDLANLFTAGGSSAVGFRTDSSISIPLLRGAGSHIAAEPLTQAERDVIYQIWQFEQFKSEFAVSVANRYLSVLQQLDVIHNSAADYESRIANARRMRRLADAGRAHEIQVDQALQDELRARQRWITAQQQYESRLDTLKEFLGLPPDALIEADPDELDRLTGPAQGILEDLAQDTTNAREMTVPPADAPIELQPMDMENAGPYELPERRALELAFDNRLDFRTTQSQVYDAQRRVVIAADNLRGELTLGGSSTTGARRSIESAELGNASYRPGRGPITGLLTLDLPLERTSEAITYRNSYINLERAVRSLQQQEDGIKISIRSALRDMVEARENIRIQARSVQVAQKRVDSVTMFLEAGDAETRDLLEAQDALLAAQNALSQAVVNYRITELVIQRDMGVLRIDEEGLWQEYQPGDDINA